MTTSEPSSQVFLTSKQVRQRYGNISQQWLWQRQQPESDFPQPIRIQGRRFWKLQDLENYEASLASK